MPSNFNASGSVVFATTIVSLVFYLSVDRVCNMFETLAHIKYELSSDIDDSENESENESEDESDSEIDESDIY
jgi:hypothetical protein